MARHAMDRLTLYNVFISLLTFWTALKFTQFLLNRRRHARLIQLKGPANRNFFFGRASEMLNAKDHAPVYRRWAEKYGPVFQMPVQLGARAVVICDHKGIEHVFSKDTFTYHRHALSKNGAQAFFGNNMLCTEREDHRRQRRALTPAFSNAALRAVTGVFYDSAYKLKASWSASLESSDETVVDIQKWINRITLDIIGIGGFGHDFKALEGHKSPVFEVFESFNSVRNSARQFYFLVGPIFPQIVNMPTERGRAFRNLRKATSDIATHLLEDTEQIVKDRSILGQLVKGETDASASFKLDHYEAISHINLMLFAGFETTTVVLAWSLVELARNPEIQSKLRGELREFAKSDPTWDQLTSGLPYLDAVLHESLRLHSPVEELDRDADEDDIIPLGTPIETASGQIIDSLFIPKGTTVTVPVSYINRNENFWGPDANSFVPERWLKESSRMPKDLHSHRHILSFAHGPRVCLGRGFALAELKAVLVVLVRNFEFELLNGPDTELDIHFSVFPQPKMAGEEGCVLPMRIRQVLE